MTEPRRIVALAYLGNPHDHPLWQEVADELDRASSLFDRFNSGHEGWAVIKEELDELWDHVRGACVDLGLCATKCNGSGTAARQEAIQVAAMALRYLIDVAGTEGDSR